MADETTSGEVLPADDERAIGRKYGIRELVYPDADQVKMLMAFLSQAGETGRPGVVPKTAVLVTLEFLQGTVNRQHITKAPRMAPEEYDLLQKPYAIAARIVSRIQRERQEAAPGRVYEATWISLHRFIELLRSLVDPSCVWVRARTVPPDVLETMTGLRTFLALYADHRRKARPA